jgi:hypothetical protein
VKNLRPGSTSPVDDAPGGRTSSGGSALRSRVALAVVTAALLTSVTAHAGIVRRALIVAYNGSDRPGTAPLRFADDDGYRWREVLERLGFEATLLTVPDADTAALEAQRGKPLLVPTTSGLEAAVAAIAERTRLDRASGAQVDVVVIYVGHGQTNELGRAYLTLVDGRLDQTALYEQVVDRLGADFVHLIIDACHAGGVVGSRGADPALLDELKTRLAKEQLKAHPTVGALFAESEEGETHEWSRLRAGIFSHAARSALLGAADVNHDGSIAYGELDAFVASSIRGVKGGRARLRLKTSPPELDPGRVLAGPAPWGPTLRVPMGPEFSRLSIEDADGVRLLDVNRQDGERVSLSLPVRDAYWLRTAKGEARVTAGELGSGIILAAAEVGTRGGLEEGYTRGLFAVPFGRGFFDGYQASQGGAPLEFLEVGGEAEPVADPGRFDGAWLGWGVSVGAPVMLAPLGAVGVSGGLSAAFRTDGWLYWGGRAQWTLALGTLGGATVHRSTLGPLVGLRGRTAVAPFIEVSPQWAPIVVVRPTVTQGDLSAFGAHLAAGVMGSRTFLRGLRVSLSVDLDAVQVDGARRAVVIPGAELSMTF